MSVEFILFKFTLTKESNLTSTEIDIHGEYAKLRYFENLLTA